MKSGFYYTKNEAEKSIKLLKVLSKYIFTINGPKMAIIIAILFPMIFLRCRYRNNFVFWCFFLPHHPCQSKASEMSPVHASFGIAPGGHDATQQGAPSPKTGSIGALRAKANYRVFRFLGFLL